MKTPNEYFEYLCLSIQNDAYIYISNMAYNQNIIEDVLQEAFLEAFIHIEDLMKMDEESQRAYIYTYARNRLFKTSKKEYEHRNNCNISDCDDIVDNKDFTEIILAEEQVDYLLSKLPEKERELIEMKYLKGYMMQELADMRNETLASTKMRIKRIKNKLLTIVCTEGYKMNKDTKTDHQSD